MYIYIYIHKYNKWICMLLELNATNIVWSFSISVWMNYYCSRYFELFLLIHNITYLYLYFVIFLPWNTFNLVGACGANEFPETTSPRCDCPTCCPPAAALTRPTRNNTRPTARNSLNAFWRQGTCDTSPHPSEGECADDSATSCAKWSQAQQRFRKSSL